MKVEQARTLPGRQAGCSHRDRPMRADAGPEGCLLELQRLAGNRAVARTVCRTIQRVILPDDVKAAVEGLRKKYPRIAEGDHGRLGKDADEFWQHHMRGMTLDEVVTQMLGNYLKPAEKDTRISVAVVYDGGAILIKVNLPEADKGAGLVVNQLFKEDSRGQLVAEIKEVYAPGRGRKVVAQGLLPLFEQLGIKQVKLTASRSGDRDDGKFAWARYGFIPVPEDWETMRRDGLTALKTSYRSHYHKVWYEEALAVVQSSDPRMLRRLVFLSWQYENQDDSVKKFLNYLLSNNISWRGEIDLGNESDRAWIANYVNSADAEAFAKLVPPRLVPDHPSGCCVII